MSSVKQKLVRLVLHPDAVVRRRLKVNMVKTAAWRRMVDSNPRRALGLYWFLEYGHHIDWNNPRTLNEKIQWLEAFTDTSLWTECADKYLVRRHIESLGLGKYLPKLYGVWDHVEDIDFDALPDSFAIKCNHDCGSTIVVRDKQAYTSQWGGALEWLKKCLNEPMGYRFCEPHYIKIPRKIIAEELLPSPNFDTEGFASDSPLDYKIWCINGKAELGVICYDRINGHAVYDAYDVRKWQRRPEALSEAYQHQNFKPIPRPKNLEEMLDVAEKIAAGFPQLRVDLYNIDGKIYFGEMTFTAAGGRMFRWSDTFQLELGAKIVLPEANK